MSFNPFSYRYPSRRSLVYGNKGMIATSVPLAAQAGLEILKRGGNAIDAAIATAICLTVVEPTSNGIGGDAFAIVYHNGKLVGLNSSGFAPKLISAEKFIERGLKRIPKYGFPPVTVPGAPAAWAYLSRKFGKLPFKELFEPAIAYAEEGFPISVTVASSWKKAFETYSKLSGEEFSFWFKAFCYEGRPPEPGEIIKLRDHAKTLRKLAESHSEEFYKGEIAERIDNFSRKYGGYIRKEDLASFEPEEVNPLSINYRGYEVYELPPNSQGMVVLIALGILSGFKMPPPDTPEALHLQIESIKLAFEDAFHFISDPRFREIPIKELLGEDRLEKKRALISDRAYLPKVDIIKEFGTVYLATADKEGNMVSFIQSNFTGFGSGLVVPETGIALHNRGYSFSLDPKSPNFLEPGKRPYHTIIPGFLMKEGKPIGPFGVMGAFMQPQGHLQVLSRIIDWGMNPQEALDGPRWQWRGEKTLHLESKFLKEVAETLKQMGHEILYSDDVDSFGRGQVIWQLENGTLIGATEPRADGYIAVF
ncbi:MAG: gamma-glutamyltransferase [Synergistetes bacterium]|nr:gamma-glutamyltransferase [Synergistota bacterium]MCX8128307.1 gamma-glutamyltransferase [Synergistota bacterium]MDW8192626.1 gamma-glutamyltransferase [Synergistota bacterium]